MIKVLQELLELQSADLKLSDARKRLAAFPAKLAELDAGLASAKAQVDKAKAGQLAAVKDRKKYDLDVEQWKERVRKYKEQSAQVKTNEAYKALQHEIEGAEAEIAKAEDRLLEQMVASEQYDRELKAAERALKEAEGVVAGQRKRVEAEREATQKEVVELEAERNRLVPKIPENLLDNYERIARKHNGTAMAEVRDEKCTACGMRVRPHVFQEMRRANSEELFHCETCTRILYYVEPDSMATPVPASNSAHANSAASE
ncbi:MAG TPA: C4-type zinc ribbon domain-containing protein [Candidatus Acidoferrales bacterium]|nr:C4-type zinc ribbon domain-containing protein [Candidatus Acidoferrales bacterium]